MLSGLPYLRAWLRWRLRWGLGRWLRWGLTRRLMKWWVHRIELCELDLMYRKFQYYLHGVPVSLVEMKMRAGTMAEIVGWDYGWEFMHLVYVNPYLWARLRWQWRRGRRLWGGLRGWWNKEWFTNYVSTAGVTSVPKWILNSYLRAGLTWWLGRGLKWKVRVSYSSLCKEIRFNFPVSLPRVWPQPV